MVISSFIEPYSKNCLWDEGLKSVMRDVLQGLQVGRASIWISEWRLTFTLTMNNSVFGLCQLVLGHGLRKVNSKGKNSAATTNSKSKSKNETLASSTPSEWWRVLSKVKTRKAKSKSSCARRVFLQEPRWCGPSRQWALKASLRMRQRDVVSAMANHLGGCRIETYCYGKY